MAEVNEVVSRANMAELKEIVDRVLLPLQLSLGIWQIMKLTPLWAVMRCTVAYLLTRFSVPDRDYNKLKGFQGRVFKKVISHATTAGNVKKHKGPKKPKKEGKSENVTSVTVDYLGKKFELDRKEGNILSIKDWPVNYCITDKMWETVLYIGKVAKETVFVKSHKEIWEEVVTGDIMEFEEVLNSVILDNRSVIRLDHDYFLPVNLLKSEDKLLKILNLLGLFLQTQKHIHWLIPASLSFTSAVMGFSTTLRLSIDGFINRVLCRTVQMVFDQLPLPMRRRAYFWGNWVENLKPSNDLQSKIVRDNICALVAGGAKAHFESLADFESLPHPRKIRALVPEVRKTAEQKVPDSSRHQYLCVPFIHNCAKGLLDIFGDCESLADRHETWTKVGPFFFKCESVYIEWIFDRTHHRCSLKAGFLACHEAEKLLKLHCIDMCNDDDCGREEDINIFTPDYCEVANHEKGGEYCKLVPGDGYFGAEEHTKSFPSDCCVGDKHVKGRGYCMSVSNGESCGAEKHTQFIADTIDTASVDVYCNSQEAIKLFQLAFYMAEQKSGSLKSYEPNARNVSVRSFTESINAYVRSSYPPLYKLRLPDDVVVR